MSKNLSAMSKNLSAMSKKPLSDVKKTSQRCQKPLSDVKKKINVNFLVACKQAVNALNVSSLSAQTAWFRNFLPVQTFSTLNIRIQLEKDI